MPLRLCRQFITALIFSIAAILTSSASAQDTQRIAVTVNDAIISTYDVEQRVNLVVFSAGVDRDPQTLARVRQQVIRQLVDEALKLQEALHWEVTVTEQELDQAIQGIAGRNDMDGDGLFALLLDSGVNPNSLIAQVRTDLAWNALVAGLLRQQVSVNEEEIDFVLNRMRQSVNQPQYQISEIFLTVDNPDQDQQVRQNAERLISQIRQGASFPAVARQFSQNSSAARGGDLGWVQDGQLPDEINEALRRLTPGQFSLPIRSTGGYYVMALRDRRITGATDPALITLNLRQIVVPIDISRGEDHIRSMGETAFRASESVTSCEQMRTMALASPILVGGDIGVRRMTDLNDQFIQALRGVPEGATTAPIPSRVGFHILHVCDRQGDEVNLPSHEEIEEQLFDQQLSSVARRHLRDLRRDALIEYREGFGG